MSNFSKETLQYFADYKRSLGYNVNIISLEQEEQRTPEEIKGIIQDQYDDLLTRPDYVLLVGDHPKLPAYSGDGLCDDNQHINRPITDVEYVLLEGWDMHRDAFIGRWPAISTENVQAMANKTIYMEMNMHLWEKKAVFITGFDSNSITMHFFELGLNNIREETFVPLGYNCTQLNQPEEIIAQEELGDNPVFYFYSGHGACSLWGRIADDPLWFWNSNSIATSIHQVFPMTFAFACKTGHYACNGISIAEQWMRQKNGGVTYVGSSVSTFPICDNRIAKHVFGDAFTEEETIGGIMAIGMSRFYGSSFKAPFRGKRYVRAYNLMGDPSFRVRGLGCVEDYYVDQLYLSGGDVQYYRASENVTFSDNVDVGNGSELIVSAGSEIVFRPGFTAFAGAEVSAMIEECSPLQRLGEVAGEQLNGGNGMRDLYTIDYDRTRQVKVYPNPTDGEVTVEILYAMNGRVSIQVMDIFGKHMMELEENVVVDAYQKRMDISSLPTGCYYVVVSVGENREVRCIIKQ